MQTLIKGGTINRRTGEIEDEREECTEDELIAYIEWLYGFD